MKTIWLVRDPDDNEGTRGKLMVDYQVFCHTLELPDRNNQPNISRIPAGRYRCVWHKSPRFGWVYLVTGVDGRSFILTHAGNWAGDAALGYRTDVQGCILLGTLATRLAGQKAIGASRAACRRFFKRMNKQDFYLVVLDPRTQTERAAA